MHLNSVCCLISYTRLLMKLNVFEILLYVTFLAMKFSRFTVLQMSYQWLYSPIIKINTIGYVIETLGNVIKALKYLPQ